MELKSGHSGYSLKSEGLLILLFKHNKFGDSYIIKQCRRYPLIIVFGVLSRVNRRSGAPILVSRPIEIWSEKDKFHFFNLISLRSPEEVKFL